MDYQDLELMKWEDDGGSTALFDSPATANERVIYLRAADCFSAQKNHDAEVMARLITHDADLIITFVIHSHPTCLMSNMLCSRGEMC